MNNQIVVSLIAVLAAFAIGCGTTSTPPVVGIGGAATVGTNATANVVNTVTEDVVNSGALQIIGQLGTTAALAFSPSVRTEGPTIYLLSSILSQLLTANGTVPTTEQIQAAATSVGINVNLAASAQVVQMIVGQMKSIVTGLGGNGAVAVKGAAQFLTGVAQGSAQYAPATPAASGS